jgi:membrane associated rhomboid family serine protease
MGLADRDYLRERPRPTSGGGGGAMGSPFGSGGPRQWSATAWLIVICVAVFVGDRVLWRGWPNTYAPGGSLQILDEKEWAKMPRIPRGDLYERIRRTSPSAQVGERFVTHADPIQGEKPIFVEDVLFVPPIQKYLQFTTAQGFMQPSSKYGLVGFEFWRFFGYQFLHAHWLHLLMNMMGLWIFGLEVERFLGRKRFVAFYLLCGFFGAFFYMLMNGLGVALLDPNTGKSIAPFLPNSLWLPLIGASGSVYGVIIAGARLAPNDVVDLLGIIPIRLRTLAIFLILTALFALFSQSSNAGGEAAHLGGAMAGYFFIRRPNHLNNFFDILGRVDPTSRSNRTRRELKRASLARVEVDAILDKVRDHGIQSLTDREREVLRRASRD